MHSPSPSHSKASSGGTSSMPSTAASSRRPTQDTLPFEVTTGDNNENNGSDRTTATATAEKSPASSPKRHLKKIRTPPSGPGRESDDYEGSVSGSYSGSSTSSLSPSGGHKSRRASPYNNRFLRMIDHYFGVTKR